MPTKKTAKPSQVLNQLLEMEASPVDRALRIRMLEQMCTDGYKTEVNTAKGSIVTVELVEPRTALACNRALGEIFERYEDIVMGTEETDPRLTIVISDLLSEDAPAVTE